MLSSESRNTRTTSNSFLSLLRWSERYTKIDMVYLFKGGSWLGAGQVITALCSFILSIAFANLFPKEAYGEYRYIFSVVGVATAFSLTGIETALSQAIARGFDRTLNRASRATFRWSLVASAILAGSAIYYFFNHNETLGWSLVIAAVATPLLKTVNLYAPFLLGKKDFGRRVRYGMLSDIVPTGIIIACLFITHDPVVLIASYFVSYVLIATLIACATQRAYPTATQSPEDPSAVPYAFHLSAMNVIGTVSFTIDKVLMFQYLGAAQLAAYTFALAMPQQLRQIQKHVATLVFPKYSEQPIEIIRQTILEKSLRLALFMAGITVTYIITAPFLFSLFFPQYMESVPYSQLFSLVLLTAPVVFFKQALTAHKKTNELYFNSALLPLIKIILLIFLIKPYGLIGAIATLLTMEFLGMLLSIILFYRARSEENV